MQTAAETVRMTPSVEALKRPTRPMITCSATTRGSSTSASRLLSLTCGRMRASASNGSSVSPSMSRVFCSDSALKIPCTTNATPLILTVAPPASTSATVRPSLSAIVSGSSTG